jgi:hypothetical protein
VARTLPRNKRVMSSTAFPVDLHIGPRRARMSGYWRRPGVNLALRPTFRLQRASTPRRFFRVRLFRISSYGILAHTRGYQAQGAGCWRLGTRSPVRVPRTFLVFGAENSAYFRMMGWVFRLTSHDYHFMRSARSRLAFGRRLQRDTSRLSGRHVKALSYRITHSIDFHVELHLCAPRKLTHTYRWD